MYINIFTNFIHTCRYSIDVYITIKGDYYMRNGMTTEQGVTIVIHDPTKPPNINSEGIPARPGTSTHIGLTHETLKRLKSPYASNCSSEWADEEYFGIAFI